MDHPASVTPEPSTHALNDVHRLQLELQRQRELLHLAGRLSGTGSWIWECGGDQSLTISPTMAEILDIDPAADITFGGLRRLIAPEFRDAGEASTIAAMRAGVRFSYDAQIVRPMASRVWIRSTGEAVLDSDGRPLRLMGAVQLIEDERQRSLEMSASEARFRMVAEATTDAVWDWDLRTDAMWWSEGISTLFGYPPESLEADSRSWTLRLHPDDFQRVVDGIHAVIDGQGSAWEDRYRFMRADGQVAHVYDRGFVFRDEDGRPIRMVGGMSDRTAEHVALVAAQHDASIRQAITQVQQELAALDLNIDVSLVMQRMAQAALDFTSASSAVIELVEGAMLRTSASVGELACAVGVVQPLANTLSGRAIRRGGVLSSPDLSVDSRFIDGALAPRAAVAAVAAPLRAGHHVVGVLKLLGPPGHAFSEADVFHLQVMVETLGSTIERRRFTEQLKASEQQYRALFGDSVQPMWVYDQQTLRMLEVNDAALEHYGYTRAEFLKMSVRDLWLDPSPEREARLREAIARGETGNSGLTTQHRCADGRIIDVDVRATNIIFNSNRCRLVLVLDITERLRTERELARISRAQSMRSSINEVLVRANDEPSLLRDVCDIAIRLGGYRAAAVGFARHDSLKSIELMAYSGIDEDYLRSMPMSWDDQSPYGQGPSGRCIRTGEPILVADTQTDPSFALWRERAARLNLLSAVCLPLKQGKQAFGFLYLYSADALDLSGDEVKLLLQLCEDVSFGVESLRARAAEHALQDSLLRIGRAVSARSNDAFFQTLAADLTQCIGVDAAFMGRLRGHGSELVLLGGVADGAPLDGSQLSLVGLPLDVSQSAWHCESDLDACASHWSWLEQNPGYQSAMALRLDDGQGKPLGLLLALSRQPRAFPDLAMSSISIFASRASAELERQDADQRIHDQAELLDQAYDAIFERSLDGRILYWNKGAERLYGYTLAEILGQSVLAQVYKDLTRYHAAMNAVLRDGQWHGEFEQRDRAGRPLIVEARWTLVRDRQGLARSIFAINKDITERKATERQIERLAFYDALTSLPNRSLLLDRLGLAMAHSARHGRLGALLFIDLDNFKTLNDTLGHDMGDLLLQQIATRLVESVRNTDTVGRLGGDEFVVLLEDMSSDAEQAKVVTRNVADKVLAALSMPYLLGTHQHLSSASIGVAPFHGKGTSVNELLKQADLAMYQAKAAGRNTVRFFDPVMQRQITERVALEYDMRLGLERQEFLLHYQPQVGADGQVTGVEALVRWQHPQRGMVSPALFIPLAEESAHIMSLGHLVLMQACTLLASWRGRPDCQHLTMSVNVSPRQFRHPEFVQQVLQVLRDTGAPAHLLKLELTEGLLLEETHNAIARMRELLAHGIGFSLDDFGTGYSSLSYLRRLPLHQLKIDQSFLRELLANSSDRAIAGTIVALGQALDLNVIAEGVETQQQRDVLLELGCLCFQGYLFSKPLPAGALKEFLQAASLKAAGVGAEEKM
jgi:diguanylate cyclase (GGDEF)-like protein/PAS domain S-box-containing protein